MAGSPLRIVRSLGEGFQQPTGWSGTGPLPKLGRKPSSSELSINTRRMNVMSGNLHRILDTLTPEQEHAGDTWYQEGHEHARKLGLLSGAEHAPAHEIGAGLLAVTSPANEWDRNLIVSHQLAKSGAISKGHWYRGSVEHQNKARNILGGADPRASIVVPGSTALKTPNFFENLADPSNPNFVTIDRHAHDALTGHVLTGDTRDLSSLSGYNSLAHVYNRVAKERELLPNVAQARSWVGYKQLKGDRTRGFDFHEYLRNTGQHEEYENL